MLDLEIYEESYELLMAYNRGEFEEQTPDENNNNEEKTND